MGDEADRARYAELLTTYLLAARRRARRRVPRAGRRQPAAGPRLEGSRLAGRHRARARRSPSTSATAPRTHFEAVQHGLDRLGIAHEINPRLVRGLDYYTSTTFEFASQALDAAQNGIGGGGRYDGLVEQMGGKPTPGIGFGIGIERVLIACAAEGVVLGRRRRRPTCSSSTAWSNADRGHAARHRAARGRHARRAHLRRPRRSAQMEAADRVRRALHGRCSGKREAERGRGRA